MTTRTFKRQLLFIALVLAVVVILPGLAQAQDLVGAAQGVADKLKAAFAIMVKLLLTIFTVLGFGRTIYCLVTEKDALKIGIYTAIALGLSVVTYGLL